MLCAHGFQIRNNIWGLPMHRVRFKWWYLKQLPHHYTRFRVQGQEDMKDNWRWDGRNLCIRDIRLLWKKSQPELISGVVDYRRPVLKCNGCLQSMPICLSELPDSLALIYGYFLCFLYFHASNLHWGTGQLWFTILKLPLFNLNAEKYAKRLFEVHISRW